MRDPRAEIRAEVDRIAAAPLANAEAIFPAGSAALRLGMQRETGLAYSMALQVLGHFIARRDAQRALAAEAAIYNTFVRAIEDEDHYERCFASWREPMVRLGRSFAAPLPERASPDGVLRVGFVFNSGVVLGHTEVLMRMLEARQHEQVIPRLYALFGANDAFLARAAAQGVPVESYPGGSVGPHAWLRARMAANNESTAVWVSAPPAALFMFGARVAPVQVFWSLKHHPIRSGDIDGYITYGAWGERERVFHGQRWVVCPVPFALDQSTPSPDDVKALRALFPQSLLFGTLAREEKIDSRPFLESVVALLRRHPQAGYVWTGRTRHEGIDEFFRASGVAERCHFVGWVDTTLYAAILDVFLETFPFGCGVTGYQALAAGVPLVSYLEPNTVFGMQYWSEVAGRPGERPVVTREALDAYPVLVARNPGEYVELVSRIVGEEAFRVHWLERERRFFEDEVLRTGRYSQRFFDTIAAMESHGKETA